MEGITLKKVESGTLIKEVTCLNIMGPKKRLSSLYFNLSSFMPSSFFIQHINSSSTKITLHKPFLGEIFSTK